MPTTHTDGWLSRKDAAAYVGRRRAGRPTNPETIGDWMNRGLRGVRLRYELRGVQFFTRAEWIDEFFAALKRLKEGHRAQTIAAMPPPPMTGRRQRALERRYAKANEAARKAGIA